MKRMWIITCFAAGLLIPSDGFAMAIGVRGAIDLKASSVFIDSFDSSDPAYSTNGMYSALQNKDGGDVVAAPCPNRVVQVGNAIIAGRIRTDPVGRISLGPLSSVGSLSWIQAGLRGIQPGWARDDAVVNFPGVVLPSGTFSFPAGEGTGGSGSVLVEGVPESFDHIFTVSGDYLIPENKSIYVGTNAMVRLWVTSTNFSPAKILVAGTGPESGRLAAYMQGPMLLTGSHTTQSGNAANLVFLGLPSCPWVRINPGISLACVVYAPDSGVVFMGGAETTHLSGSVVGGTVQVNGHAAIHFDENLFRMRSPFPFVFPGAPWSQNALVGWNLSLSVVGIGDEPLTCEWYRDGVVIPNETGPILTITNAQVADAGLYHTVMTVSNVPGAITSLPGYLGVFETPAAKIHATATGTNGLRIRVAGITGYRYVTERSSNLVDWVRFRTNQEGSFDIVETNVTGALQRFYRAVYEP